VLTERFAWERKIVDRKVLLLGLLVLVGAGAFVYLDPMDLDLLGLKQQQVVAQTAVTPRHPAAPQAAAQAQKKAAIPAAAPVAEPAVAKAKPAAAPKVAAAPAEPPPAPAAEAPDVSAEAAAKPAQPMPVAAVAPPAMKPAKAESKPPRPKNLDLRHCLDLKTDAEIAKCAGE
jgi:hypothetical protein